MINPQPTPPKESKKPTKTPEKSSNKNSAKASTHRVKIHGGDELQYYSINLMVGESGNQQSVIVDTGSDLTAFPCSKIF